jgi:phage FluMu protein Com
LTGEKEEKVMYKIISCPQCGQKLCRAEIGSKVEIICPKCKTECEGYVDKNGGVHALPLDIKSVQAKAVKN